MRAILDTNLLVSEALVHQGYETAVCSISWAELGFGVRKAAGPIERARRETRLSRLRALFGPGVPFDDAAADAYGTACGLVLAHGREVRGRTVDLMIAATAAAQGAVLLTRNTDDFLGLEGFVTVLPA